MLTNNNDDMVLALHRAPVDPRTGNKVVYNACWIADSDSMIGERNEDWVRRELDWFNGATDKLEDMEGPVPALFEACAGDDGRVNSAYGYILFSRDPEVLYSGMHDMKISGVPSLYERALAAFKREGLATRHAVVIVSDRDIHALSIYNGRNDFICTNALNFMIDASNRLHIVAQMRSMDAVFGYRADYSMWDNLMDRLVDDLNRLMLDSQIEGYKDPFETVPSLRRGNITFQVANLHVYPRHLQLLEDTAEDTNERLSRRAWMTTAQRTMAAETTGRAD